MSLIEQLEWRYATKRYNSEKTVSEEDIAYLQRAIQLSASSYGLQLYKVLMIEDKALRAQLKAASWNQPQIDEASHLFVFCTPTKATDGDVDHYLDLKAKAQGIERAKLDGYGDMMKGAIGSMDEGQQQAWMAKQAYIALSTLLVACAERKIDSSPMEGFDPTSYGKILGLEEKGLKACVVAAVGYRSDEDDTQHAPKVRKDLSELFDTI